MNPIKSLAAAALFVASVASHAGIVTYSDHASWVAASGAVTGSQNFDGMSTPTPLAGGVSLGSGITASSSGTGYGPWTVESNPGLSSSECDLNGTNRLCGFNGHVLTFTFADGITAFSADFSGINDDVLRTVFQLLSGDTVIATVGPSITLGQGGGFNRFWGFTADAGELITGMRTMFVQNDTFGLDNIEIVAAASTSVPEPGSLALLGLGLVGLAAARKRKQA